MAARNVIARLWKRQEGASAVEFALVLPILLMLTLGAIGATIMLYSVVSLHYAVEDAARCVSVKTLVCTSQATMRTYAANRYKGPTLASLTFNLTPATAANCGNRVVGTGTLAFTTGIATVNLPISASSCYPT